MEQLEDCVSFVIGKAAQRVSRRARELLDPFGVTPAQYAVLRAVCDAPGTTAAALIRRLAIDTATLTGIIDRLEASGHLARTSDSQDRRLAPIHPRAAGASGIADMNTAMEQLNHEVRALMGAGASSALTSLKRLHQPATGEQKR